MLVDLIGHDAAAAHLNDAVSHTGQCRVVGNNNDGASGLAAGILQKTQHLLAGALDYKTGKQVLALLQRTCRETGRTVIVITHNTALTAMADRIIQVKSGQILSNKVNEHPVPVEQIEW